MSRTVLFLLTIFTVRGRGCDDLNNGTIRNLQKAINHEIEKGFPEVFPDDYEVQHYFNASAECHERCCVFSAALLLSQSWMKVLEHLARVHLKRAFIVELMLKLDNISKESFQETPDPSILPPVHSSPSALLTFTSKLLSNWQALGCPFGKQDCVFPTLAPPSPEEEEEEVEKFQEVKESGLDEQNGKEGERGKRWITAIPTNGFTVSSTSLCILSALFSLRMVLHIVLR